MAKRNSKPIDKDRTSTGKLERDSGRVRRTRGRNGGAGTRTGNPDISTSIGTETGTGTGTDNGDGFEFESITSGRDRTDSTSDITRETEAINNEPPVIRKRRVSKKQVYGNASNVENADTFAKQLTPDLLGFVFAIPALFGLGDFWYLNSDEEKELSEATWTAIRTLPKTKRKQFEKWVSEYIPFIMFALVAGTIIGKRVVATFEMMKTRKPGKLYSMPKQEGKQNESSNESFEGESKDASFDSGYINGKRYISDPISEAFGSHTRQ